MYRILSLFFIGTPLVAQEPSVRVAGGDVFIYTRRGQELRMTQDGRSKEAALSPGGELVAILRMSDDGLPEIQVVDATREDGRVIARVGGRLRFSDYQTPLKGELQWSPSGECLYFLLDFTDTSNYLARLDLTSGRWDALSDALKFVVVRSGKYKGKLIALKRKHTLVRVWDWYWLLDEKGEEIGPIGDRGDVAEFLDRFEKQ